MAALKMEIVLMLVLLTYAESTFGQKNVCATPGNPITVTVNGIEGMKGDKGEKGDSGTKGDKGDSGTKCQCNSQDPNKPSVHIEANHKGPVTYQANTVKKDWSISDTRSQLAGGMTYHIGNLTVPTPGRYYIYTQLYYHSTGRVYVRVNSNPVTMIQPLSPGTGEGALYAGGVFNLNAGDVIWLDTPNSITLYVFPYHCYFGAFLI